MKLKELLDDNDAVSPVIGVILMVAITVILAAVIASFVLGLGDQTQDAPTVSFDYDYDQSAGELTITKSGGDDVTSGQVTVTGDGVTSDLTFHGDGSVSSSSDDITSGDSITTTSISTGDTVRIVWSAEDQESSTTLSTYDIQS